MFHLEKEHAKRIWLRAQRLDTKAPFGADQGATAAAIEHLGYVQIDTINVIERCHHHILFTRIPDYQRAHLHHAQKIDRTIFEYWTHALSYVPVRDFRFYVSAMKRYRTAPGKRFDPVTKADLRKVLKLIREQGALSIRDIDDDVLVEKDHPWASRKPSRRALQLAFYAGWVTISQRAGMLKTYELAERHFGWDQLPKAATEPQIAEYLIDRAIRAQGVVSLESICYLDAKRKVIVSRNIEKRVRDKRLVPVKIDEGTASPHWIEPATLEQKFAADDALIHLLSPFDPLVIQRKRLHAFFDYQHRFEAYVPKAKRVFGYFTLPVLAGSEIVAAIDLKADRQRRQLLVQKWTWVGRRSGRELKQLIEDELHRFEKFQLT